ncbi:hypothetical protein JCM10212_006033 [Sporobolomyces blumeae]
MRGRRAADSRSDDLTTHSQPVEGPGESGEGDLGEQTHSLDSLDWDRRTSRISNKKNELGRVSSETAAEEDGGQRHGLVERTSDEAGLPGQTEEEEAVEQLASSVEDASEAGQRESQKENATSIRRSPSLAVRQSRSHLEPSASASSSSPAVAEQLLRRLSPRKRPLEEANTMSRKAVRGQSSTSPAIATASNRVDEAASSSPGYAEYSFAGPKISTCAVANPLPPEPSTQGRRMPAPALLTKSKTEPSRPSDDDSRPAALFKTSTTGPPAVNPAIFATSAGMTVPAPGRRRKKEAWDGISQDTPQESESGQVESEVATSPTQVETAEEVLTARGDEETEEAESDRQETPKPTAERTLDMDIDEGDSTRDLSIPDTGVLGDTTLRLPHSSQRSHRSNRSNFEPQHPSVDQSIAASPSSDLDARVHDLSNPLFLDPSRSTSSSPGHTFTVPAAVDSSGQQDVSHPNKRLSDISELTSSQEIPATQFDGLEGTQKVYDAEQSSIRHTTFAYEDLGASTHSRQRSNPVPGRELRRMVVPATPNEPDPARTDTSTQGAEPTSEAPSAGALPSSSLSLPDSSRSTIVAQVSAGSSRPVAGKEALAGAAKGKGRAVEREGPDETDGRSYGAGPAINRSDQPSDKGAKKRSTEEAIEPVVQRARPRRPTSRPAIIEDSDDEADEPSKIEETPQKRPRSPPTAKVKSPPEKRSKQPVVIVPRPAAAKKKAVARGHRSGSSTETRDPASTAPDRPVAGPSRSKREHPDIKVDSPRADSTTSTSSSRARSRLPPSAPFDRCFGLWRDDGYLYSGTILSCSSGAFQVRFDDGTDGKLRTDEICRCELTTGDWVQYCGDDGGTERPALSRTRDWRVVCVERDPTGRDAQTPLDSADVVVVADANGFGSGRRTERLPVADVRISPAHIPRFNDRKLAPHVVDAFEGRSTTDSKPLPILASPRRPDLEAFVDNGQKAGLFGRMAFLVTSKSKDPDRIARYGGTLIEWEHLFEVKGGGATDPPGVEFPVADFEHIDTILLLAEGPTTTSKYLVALALGIPCCSKNFIDDSINQNTRLDWRAYAISSGFSRSLGTNAVFGQLRAMTKTSFGLDSLAKAQRSEGVFAGQTFLVVVGKAGKKAAKPAFDTHNYLLYSLLAAASAARVHFLSLPFPSASPFTDGSTFVASASTYTHVFLDFDDADAPQLAKAVRPLYGRHKQIVNMEWLKQCLITGTLLPSERMKRE